MTIDMLPDVALLKIFDFYVEARADVWYTLVQVCRNWRSVAFGSPRRLNLQLHCGARTPVRETLDVWPPLPIVVRSSGHEAPVVDNLVAALEYNDRISEINLYNMSSSQFERVSRAMHQPFPALEHLNLGFNEETALVDPASFLGGSAPRLRSLGLIRNPLPGLPKLLLSTTHLTHLTLWFIPHSVYISPEVMASCLSVLTRLETLELSFESPRSRPDRQRPPPPTRALLPVLNSLHCSGVSEYLEDLMARIDAPLLDNLQITFFHQLIFNTPQLTQFISRTPKFKTHDTAHLLFSAGVISATVDERLRLEVSCSRSDWQLSSLAQVCGSSFPRALISAVDHLCLIEGEFTQRPLPWQDDIDNGQWLEIFRPFTAVKYLYISSEFMRHATPALQELIGERVAEVLPALLTLFLEEIPSGPFEEAMGQLFAARELVGRPIALIPWKRKRVEG